MVAQPTNPSASFHSFFKQGNFNTTHVLSSPQPSNSHRTGQAHPLLHTVHLHLQHLTRRTDRRSSPRGGPAPRASRTSARAHGCRGNSRAAASPTGTGRRPRAWLLVYLGLVCLLGKRVDVSGMNGRGVGFWLRAGGGWCQHRSLPLPRRARERSGKKQHRARLPRCTPLAHFSRTHNDQDQDDGGQQGEAVGRHAGGLVRFEREAAAKFGSCGATGLSEFLEECGREAGVLLQRTCARIKLQAISMPKPAGVGRGGGVTRARRRGPRERARHARGAATPHRPSKTRPSHAADPAVARPTRRCRTTDRSRNAAHTRMRARTCF